MARMSACSTVTVLLVIAQIGMGQNSVPIRAVALPGTSPVVSIRLVFTTGAMADPPGKPGLANLTAAMLAGGGTRDLTYKQILDALFPMASTVTGRVDQEMTTFSGSTHVENLDAYYALFRSMLLDPGWREDDFKRLKDQAINNLRVALRGNNDEELGKEQLYLLLYRGTPYGHYSGGAASALERMTLDDVRQFYKQHYAQSNLIVGVAGGYPPQFLDRVKKDFGALPASDAAAVGAVHPTDVDHTRLQIIEKNTRSVAYSLGYPIDVKRGDPDYPALLVAQSYLGQHRMGGRLFDRIREVRGINYGDYAYIEYFPRGMFAVEPEPNIARRSQIFQIWIRPAEPPQAAFTLRLAVYELNWLVKEGLSEEEFERSRQFLSKYVNVLTKTKRAELGYAIDSLYYGIPDYNSYVRTALAKLTREQVNAAIRKHLRAERLQIVAVAPNAADLKKQLIGAGPSPIPYSTPKPAAILDEDKIVERFDIGLRAEDVEIVPVEQILE
ncbi:MAG TPA: pitrilysin family protein [Bryobacteraceae bacterium]|nr:pitrilysin family protein [Bryobacteraceae bacterium]